MGIKIRQGVFETNSSSVHSLTFNRKGLKKCLLKPNAEGKIRVSLGHFGKDSNIYDTQSKKLSYLMTSCYYLAGMDLGNMYNSREFKDIEEAVMEYTGCSGIEVYGESKAYIDHQSVPEYSIEIINTYDKDEIIGFIFNKYVGLKTRCD